MREARELEERIAWEESERLRIEQERIDDEHFRRGQAEAKQASVSLLARNFYFGIKDEACTKRVQDWLTEKRDAHEAQQREMYRTIKAELKVIVRRPIHVVERLAATARRECRGDGALRVSRRRRGGGRAVDDKPSSGNDRHATARRSVPRPSPSTSSRKL